MIRCPVGHLTCGLFGGRPPTPYCCGSLVFPTGKLSPTLSLSLSLSLKLCDAGWFFNHIILLHRGQQNGRCRFRRNPFKHHDTTHPQPPLLLTLGGVCVMMRRNPKHTMSACSRFFFICCVPFTAGRELIHFPPCASGKDVLTVNQCLWRVRQTTGDGGRAKVRIASPLRDAVTLRRKLAQKMCSIRFCISFFSF